MKTLFSSNDNFAKRVTSKIDHLEINNFKLVTLRNTSLTDFNHLQIFIRIIDNFDIGHLEIEEGRFSKVFFRSDKFLK